MFNVYFIYTTLQFESWDYTCTKYFTLLEVIHSLLTIDHRLIADNKPNAFNPCYRAVI